MSAATFVVEPLPPAAPASPDATPDQDAAVPPTNADCCQHPLVKCCRLHAASGVTLKKTVMRTSVTQ
jgi:hypothetical protein